MIYAKVDSEHNVLSVIRTASNDNIINRRINDGEYFTPITNAQALAFERNPGAAFVDGVFTLLSIQEPVGHIPDIEEIRTAKIRDLERYTPFFISRKNGQVRYTKEKQSSLHAIYMRCERLIRLSEISSEVKAACEAKIVLIESVYNWIESVLEQHYVHLNALKDAETIEDLDSITWDYSALNATDPDVWLEHVI